MQKDYVIMKKCYYCNHKYPDMKKNVLFSLLLSFILMSGFAQSKEELTGTWTVNKVILPPAESGDTQQGLKEMEKYFLNSTIELAQDGKAIVSMINLMTRKEGVPEVKHTTWVYNEIDRSFLILEGEGKQKEKMFKFYVKKEGKKWKFIDDEMNLTLEVKKSK